MLEKIQSNVLLNKKIIAILILFLSVFTIFSFNPFVKAYAEETSSISDIDISMDDSGMSISGAGFDNDSKQAWESFFKRYKKIIMGVSGFATLTMILIFIYCFIKLGVSSGNEKARREAQIGILWSGIASACLGSVTLIVAFFYGSFRISDS